jgi:2-polyprenyl-6-hydroxyphenyl methylase/3-demethylubiquinone-9 3-methyltransferase
MWLGHSEHPIGLLVAENKVRTPWVIQMIEEMSGNVNDILDIGCGGGLLCNPLSEKGHRVVGIDLSQKSLDFARSQDSKAEVKYLYASAEKLPFDDASFDVCCAMDLLEHVNDPEKVISEAGRVLKKDGLFFFHTFNRNLLSYLLIIKAVECFVKNTPKDMHVYSHFIRPDELQAYCNRADLQVIEMKGLAPDALRWRFWKTAFTRKIDSAFPFRFCNSLLTGYVGIAKKK